MSVIARIAASYAFSDSEKLSPRILAWQKATGLFQRKREFIAVFLRHDGCCVAKSAFNCDFPLFGHPFFRSQTQ
jgi:hypothetical protein